MRSLIVDDLIVQLTGEDQLLFYQFLPHFGTRHNPMILAPDGEPYLYRWYIVPNNDHGNVMLHIQVKSDPERPLHDHPWDNQSVILSGGYDEIYDVDPEHAFQDVRFTRSLRRGDLVTRKAEEAHRLMLPDDIPYTMTLFTTGPRRRAWGFWYPDGWHDAKRHVAERNGISVHVTET